MAEISINRNNPANGSRESKLDASTREHLRQFTAPNYERNYDRASGEINRGNASSDYPAFGILKGDVLIFEHSYHYEEGQIGLWHINHSGGTSVVLARAYCDFGDISLDCGDGSWSIRFNPKDVGFNGVLIGIERKIESCLKSVAPKDEPKAKKSENDEISVTCEDCGKTATGSRQFLTGGMAWKIRKDKAHCVGCW